jgi:hypothetical protein
VIESCGAAGCFFVLEAEGAVFHGNEIAAEGVEVVRNGGTGCWSGIDGQPWAKETFSNLEMAR